jgi:hypothetical protein
MSFRPHHFSLKPNDKYFKQETKFVNKIDNGQFTNYRFFVWKTFFSPYAQADIADVKAVWVKPLRLR